MHHIDLQSDMHSVDNAVQVQCPRKDCRNIWGTKSEKILVSCPKCFYKLEIKKCLI